MVDNTSGIGQRFLAATFDVNQSTISRTIKNKTQVDVFKKQEVPKYEKNQETRAVTAARRLVVKIFKDKSVVMDDEKYFSLSNTSTPGNDIFYTSDKSTAPNQIKYAMKKKFEEKVLVWIAISEEGLSKHYVHKSRIAISSDIYIRECLKKRLDPFVKEYHGDNNFVFWPDLASAHYSHFGLF